MKTDRKWGRRFGVIAGLVTMFALSTAVPTEAALMMRLTEGAASVTITDGGAGDSNPVAGAITFIGSVGVFAINVSTGLSKPVLPASPVHAEMDLNSVNTSSGAGTLVIELTDTDFPALPASGQLNGFVGGTTEGTVNFAACKNDSNTEFDTVDCEAEIAIGPFTGPPEDFSGNDSDSHGAIGAYAMTLIATITHLGAAETSFDFALENVPEPATLVLFGAGLVGAGLASRRRRKAAQVA